MLVSESSLTVTFVPFSEEINIYLLNWTLFLIVHVESFNTMKEYFLQTNEKTCCGRMIDEILSPTGWGGLQDIPYCLYDSW